MKPLRIVFGCMILASFVLAMAGTAAAATANIAPFDFEMKNYTANAGDTISYSWNSDVSLVFVVTGPDGTIVREVSSTSDVYLMIVDDAGAYHFTWTNIGLSTAHLDYTVDVISLGSAFDALFWAIVIVAIIVVVVIVVVIVVVLIRPSHKQHPPVQQAYPPPVVPQYQQPVYPGQPVAAPMNCPSCGSPVDPQFQFCQRCGGRVR